MAPYGITVTKETPLYSDRSKRAAVKKTLEIGTSMRYKEAKYRENSTWIEVELLDETRTKGFLLEDESSQHAWPHYENTGKTMPLHKLENGQFVDGNNKLRKGDKFYLMSSAGGIYANIYFQGRSYLLMGQIEAKTVEEWSPKMVVMMIVMFVCMMYGALVIAPEMLPPGRYPRLLFLLPGFVIGLACLPIVWGLFYAYEEFEKRR